MTHHLLVVIPTCVFVLFINFYDLGLSMITNKPCYQPANHQTNCILVILTSFWYNGPVVFNDSNCFCWYNKATNSRTQLINSCDSMRKEPFALEVCDLVHAGAISSYVPWQSSACFVVSWECRVQVRGSNRIQEEFIEFLSVSDGAPKQNLR